MRVKFFFLAVLLFVYSGSLFSQQREIIVKLVVQDSLKGDPIEFATASLTPMGSEKPTRYALTNGKGEVTLKLYRGGEYSLKVEFMGFKVYTKQVTIDRQKENNLGKVLLQEQLNTLNSVVVSAVGNPIVIKKDTIEYNASSYKTTDSDMLEELLKKLPGVEIDSDGKITANGKEIKKIMIDGKTFFLDDPQLATKNLPAKIVEKVRVVERKSEQAQFTGIDDGNEETIIDLGIKPGMMNGWFGNVMGGYGTEERFQTTALLAKFSEKSQITAIVNGNNTNNRGFFDMSGDMMRSMRSSMRASGGVRIGGGLMNMGSNGLTTSWLAGTNLNTESKSGKLKVGGSYMFTNNENNTDTKSSRQTFIEDSSFFYNQQNWSRSVSNGHRSALQLEYAFNDKTSILFRPNVNIGYGSFNEGKDFQTYGAKGTDINDGHSLATGTNNSQTLGGDLLFRQKLGKEGRTFSVYTTYSYSNNETDGYNYSETNVYKPRESTSIVDQQYNFISKSYSVNSRASYTEPLGKNYFMELAYGVSYRYTSSDKNTYNVNDITGNYDKIDSAYTNSFENTFINQRAELNIRKVGEKYNYVIGVTAQPAYTKSIGDTTRFTRNVINFSPSAMIDFKFSESASLRARYRGNTNQPSINQLMPVPDNSNPLYRVIGNPDLLPEFEHNVSLYYRNTNRQTFTSYESRFSASYTVDKIVNKNWYDEGGIQYSMPVNEHGVYNLNGFFMYNTPFAKSKFFISSDSRVRFNKGVNYTNGMRNKTSTVTLSERLRLTYKGEKLEGSFGGSVSYSDAWYSIQENTKPATWTNSLLASINWTLPAGMNIVSDFDYRFYVGFNQESNKPSAVWNAELSKLLFKNAATLRVKIYDILNQSRNIYRNANDNYIEDVESNILKQYVMFSLTFRFGKFKGSEGGRRDRGFSPGHGPGGFRPRF